MSIFTNWNYREHDYYWKIKRQYIGGKNLERLNTIDEIVERYSVASSKLKSKIYVALGSLFLIFAIIGIWIPGWPSVSWAVPAAFLFSLSNERLFRWTLTNRFFGTVLFEYYATGKTLPSHVKFIIIGMITGMTSLSAYFVWFVSTKGVNGELFQPSTWTGADENAAGAITILVVGLIGIIYIFKWIKTRTN